MVCNNPSFAVVTFLSLILATLDKTGLFNNGEGITENMVEFLPLHIARVSLLCVQSAGFDDHTCHFHEREIVEDQLIEEFINFCVISMQNSLFLTTFLK